MSNLKLYDTERLIFIENGLTKKCRYWVLRNGISPLYIKHRVRKKHIPVAIALFKDHPKGIVEFKQNDMHFVEGAFWNPQQALDHKADSNNEEDEDEE